MVNKIEQVDGGINGNAECDDIDLLVDTAESCPRLRIKYDVDIREFVVLASLENSGIADKSALSEMTGLSVTSVEFCLYSLLENGLLSVDPRAPNQYASSTDGRALIRKARDY